jgi:non-structural maintenance of chromosomes element 4
VEEYIAKLVTFMGGRQEDETMDWTSVGKIALGLCRRPPTIGFILGPLSIQKKEKKQVERKQEKRKDIQVVRPQEVRLP